MPVPRTSIPAALATACALVTTPLSAQQSPLVLEVLGGAAVPVGSFSSGSGVGEGASAGASLSVVFALGSGRRGTYAGFSQHRFGCEDAGCATGGQLVATGFDLGLRFKLLAEGIAVPWIRVGAITSRVETDDLGGANAGVSDLGFGGEIGTGVYIGGGSPVAINPGVRFAFVRTGLPGGETLEMRYLVAQVAVALAF